MVKTVSSGTFTEAPTINQEGINGLEISVEGEKRVFKVVPAISGLYSFYGSDEEGEMDISVEVYDDQFTEVDEN